MTADQVHEVCRRLNGSCSCEGEVYCDWFEHYANILGPEPSAVDAAVRLEKSRMADAVGEAQFEIDEDCSIYYI